MRDWNAYGGITMMIIILILIGVIAIIATPTGVKEEEAPYPKISVPPPTDYTGLTPINKIRFVTQLGNSVSFTAQFTDEPTVDDLYLIGNILKPWAKAFMATNAPTPDDDEETRVRVYLDQQDEPDDRLTRQFRVVFTGGPYDYMK